MFLSTTLNVNIAKLFCVLHSMLLSLPTAAILECPAAAILEISVTSQKGRGKLCHLISTQSTHVVRQFSSAKCQSSHFLFRSRSSPIFRSVFASHYVICIYLYTRSFQGNFYKGSGQDEIREIRIPPPPPSSRGLAPEYY